MSNKVKVQPGQSIDDAIRNFNKDLRRSGKLQDAKKHNFYEKPGLRKRNRIKENQRNKAKKY